MTCTNKAPANLSPKLLTLLRASKRCPADKVLNIQAAREALADIYHAKLTVKNVVTVMFSALEELSRDPRFEVLQSADWPLFLMLAPVDEGSFYDEPDDKFHMVDFYERIVTKAWCTLQFSRVDWCRDLLWPEACSAQATLLKEQA